MTPARLAELRALVAAATPGPWLYSYKRCEVDTAQIGDDGLTYDGPHSWSPGDVYPHELDKVHADGALIAAARSAVVELLDEVERLRTECYERRFDPKMLDEILSLRDQLAAAQKEIERLGKYIDILEQRIGERSAHGE